MARFAIIHPWLPQYRLPFFRRLIPAAAARGHTVDVFHGKPPAEVRARADAMRDEQVTSLLTRAVLGPKSSVNYKSLKPMTPLNQYDAFIVEDALRNLETYRLLMQGRTVAFWGHGRTYTKPSAPSVAAAKSHLIKRGAWFFSYTEGGRKHVISQGVPAERCTIVQNSIDTTALQASIEQVTERQKARFAAEFDLRGKTAAFVGGLDQSKRLEFLFEAADLASAMDEEFRLLIGGRGAEDTLVRDWTSRRSYASYLGSLEGSRKSIALASSQLLAMPGRVGLVAVDSFVARVPIVTTKWPYHAPEFEYLSSNNALITPDSVSEYALGLVTLLHETDRRDLLVTGCADSSRVFTIDAMVENFVGGLDAFSLVL